MSKQKTLSMTDLLEEAKKSLEKWNDIYANGCSDPFWPDGINLNLVRNHILYYNSQIQSLAQKEGTQLSLFETISDVELVEVPQKVADDYMAKTRRCSYFDLRSTKK